MTMGQRIRQARLDAGLSQRQLAGDMMTRNMLSALEHDGANPSVATLRYLSEKLCKPISYLLGEDVLKIPEAEAMAELRRDFQAGQYRKCLESLGKMEAAEFALERRLLEALSALALAQQALEEKRLPYANELLRQSMEAGRDHPYLGQAFEKKWLIVAASAAQNAGQRNALIDRIEGEDQVLCLKAQAALDSANLIRAEKLLEAVEDRQGEWHWLRGEVYFAQKEYKSAAACYHAVEKERPETKKRLEICYRELEDYKMAYYYATKKG